ncbi:MAG: acetate kinase, partial [Chloroflexi bacterium]
MKILVLNVGSSSQKCHLYEMGDSLPDQPQAPLWEANADWSEHQGETHCKITTSTGQSLEEKLPTTSRQDVLAHLLKTLWSGKTQVIAQASEIDIVGHRVVHGGQEYRESTKITPAVKDAIKRLSLIDPLHNPLNLEDIEAIEQILP